MKPLKLLFAAMLLSTFAGYAQNCIKPFSANTWFNQSSKVRISPDASKFYVVGGNGPTGNSSAVGGSTTSNTIKVYDISASGITYNSGQSFNQGGVYSLSDFTANNGYFYTTDAGGGTSYYITFMSSTGVATNLGAYNMPQFSTIAGAPNKMIARLNAGGSGDYNVFLILNANNPAAPTATTVNIAGSPSSADPYIVPNFNAGSPNFAADSVNNRIYYVTTETESGATTAPNYRFKVKAATMTGTTAAGWTDLVIQRGNVWNMVVRPTDGRVFARLGQTDHHYNMHGWIVFDKNGALATDMNLTDLSITGGTGAQEEYKDLNFDANGNIYANKWAHFNGGAGNGVSTGLVKFDPNGNLDISFLRNAWNSYGQAASLGAGSFDIADNGLIIKSTYAAVGSGTETYALNLNHVNTNNEDPSTTYTSLSEPGGFNNYNNSIYQQVQFLFNNGRLVVPDMTQSAINANCGIATPTTLPVVAAAAGTIDCNSLSFLNSPVQGTASTVGLKVVINVTTAGAFKPIVVSGSGLSLQDANASFATTTTGIQEFYLTLKYDGTTALGSFTINVTGAGSCTANLSDQTKNNPSVINIWTPQNCTYKAVGPDLK